MCCSHRLQVLCLRGMHGGPAQRIISMHHIQEMCVGRKDTSPDESKTPLGSIATNGRKIVPNTTHFRTIAPKVQPKVISSAYPEITVPGSKPLLINTQNYTLMKVASPDGTFSLVALPQLSPPMGGPVLQTAGLPLHENLKLPIPRYQPAQSKKLSDKKLKVLNRPKVDRSNISVTLNSVDSVARVDRKPHNDAGKHVLITDAEKVFCDPAIVFGSGVDVGKVSDCSLPCVEKTASAAFLSSSPIKLNVDVERTECEPVVRCESAKVADSANSLAVLSPMVFGSPVHLLQSVPKGKLPILPYSKIKKSVISKCKMTTSLTPQTGIHEVQASVAHVTPESPGQPVLKSDGDGAGLGGKRRGKKRQVSSESGCQLKVKLFRSRGTACRDKVSTQVGDTGEEQAASVKKYRNIMPKPALEIQSLASLAASTSVLHSAHSAASPFRHRLHNIRPHKLRQGDHCALTENSDCKSLSSAAKALYKCHMCDHGFQFKHHLQDHLNSHTNRRPYHCRLCRKAYVHSGSLSTHMKLHHSESRLKKLMCCDFCAKVFGHIRVYFGHLKEVHRVIISTESSVKQLERKNVKVKDEVNSLNRNKRDSNEDEAVLGQADKIRLKIKCGRCHFVAPTFSDMKLHLFCEHGDEFQETLQGGVLESRQGGHEEMVKQATHYWKLLSGRRDMVKCHGPEDELVGSTRLVEPQCISGTAHEESADIKSTMSPEQRESPSEGAYHSSGSCAGVEFSCGSHYNCLLCKNVFEDQNSLFEHWKKQHNCENPLVLWTIFSSLLKNHENTS